jgi:hypothetical protein
MNNKKKLVGRPTKYKNEYNDQAYKLALLGAIDREIADFFEVNEDTIHEWKKQYPKFSESLIEGKKKADMEIAKSLYERAKGFSYKKEVAFKVKQGQHQEKIETIKITEVLPPDTIAIKYWLNNRNPERWRDKTEVEQVGKPSQQIIYIDKESKKEMENHIEDVINDNDKD